MAKFIFQKGHKVSQATRDKLRAANLGKKHSLETRKKITKIVRNRSAETRKKIGIASRNISNETRLKMSRSKLGTKRTLETRLKISKSTQGSQSRLWKGGITELRKAIRQLLQYRQWISDCFTRDDFTCQKCFERGGRLNAHHIKHFSDILDENGIDTVEKAIQCVELWNINNGKTLCKKCHELIHKNNG